MPTCDYCGNPADAGGCVVKRNCGDCHACCVHLSIDGLKDAHEPCRHLQRFGCDAYSTRPKECAVFQCHWLVNLHIPRQYRPDRCGILAHFGWNALAEKIGLHVIECQAGALDRPENKPFVQKCETFDCALVTFIYRDDRRRLFSRDPVWIADLRWKNPQLQLPRELEFVDLLLNET